ncbi:hypothetical protein Nepgr_018087 [Nepenthes gracilis]|uniref:Carbohydrate kinase PfkB domain-containing protein n=1 Tax=Nepenthes gracilis TaxID=150966 RepID=A0AAD3XTZ8_NEPGR|nr:hypothetical protein Nepgr_018087 [Nepenthes gracilis]
MPQFHGGMPVLIGGMVLDIHATPSIPPERNSTTPGKVDYILGGVARNVADCMSKLGTKSYMISAVGLDVAGNLLLEQWQSAGLPTDGIQQGLDIKTATVCNMFDADGELEAGVASVESIERCLTPEWIRQFRSTISSAPVLMVDANLSPCALEASCQMATEYGIPVWFEPVSVAKSKRVASVASYITFASPNEHELVAMAKALSGRDVVHPTQRNCNTAKYSTESMIQMLKPAILVLLENGIKFVLVTVGSDGAFLCSSVGPGCMGERLYTAKFHGMGKELFDVVTRNCPPKHYSCSTIYEKGSHLFVVHFPALPASVVRVSGAGDCMVGGILASLCSGLNVMQSVSVGVASAKAAIQVETNVPSAFSLAAISNDARVVFSSAKVVFQESAL